MLNLLTASVTFTVLTRCGFDAAPGLDENAFDRISLLDTYNTASAIGILTNSFSRAIIQHLMQLTREAASSAERPAERSERADNSSPKKTPEHKAPPDDTAPKQMSILPVEAEQEDVSPVQEEAPLLPPPTMVRKPRAAAEMLHPELTERYNFAITDDNLGAGTPGEKTGA